MEIECHKIVRYHSRFSIILTFMYFTNITWRLCIHTRNQIYMHTRVHIFIICSVIVLINTVIKYECVLNASLFQRACFFFLYSLLLFPLVKLSELTVLVSLLSFFFFEVPLCNCNRIFVSLFTRFLNVSFRSRALASSIAILRFLFYNAPYRYRTTSSSRLEILIRVH